MLRYGVLLWGLPVSLCTGLIQVWLLTPEYGLWGGVIGFTGSVLFWIPGGIVFGRIMWWFGFRGRSESPSV